MDEFSSRLLGHMPSRVKPGVRLVIRTARETLGDRVPGLAAEAAFWIIVSLPPLVLLLLGVLAFLDPSLQQDLVERVVGNGPCDGCLAGAVFREETIESVLRPSVTSLLGDVRGGVISAGAVLSIFSASRALRAVSVAITIAYDLHHVRPRWAHRVWGLVLTIAGLVVALAIVPVLVAGPGFGETLAAGIPGIGPAFGAAWRVGYWPAAAVVATGLVACLYHVTAPWQTPWRRNLPGAVLAMAGTLVGTVGLRFYVERSFATDVIYGPVAGLLVVLLWLYICAVAVLVGAELNAEVERMWPTGGAEEDQLQPKRAPVSVG